ncbi:MAG: cell division topological specificity factor MinE [Anaerolineales bacterium]
MGFLDRLLGRSDRQSASAAKKRLQLVLVHDRANLSAGRLEAMKDEMLDVISRYIDIDRESVHISLTNDRTEQRLVADIPIRPDRRRSD